MLMAHINNHTASIQSRLVGLPNLSPVLECCHLAAYVCSVMLCCKVWCALVIPVGESQTLRSLSLASLAPVKTALVHMDLTDFFTGLIHECADFGFYSPMFPHSYSTNYNRRTTTLCGTITLICYFGYYTSAGHSFQQELYAPNMSYCCARTTLSGSDTCTDHGQNCLKS